MSFRTFRIIFVLILALFACATLSACSQPIKLDAPTGLTIEGNLLTWDAVPNAVSYRVSVQEQIYQANINQHYIIVPNTSEYGIKVMAVGDGKDFVDSDYSSIIKYVKTEAPGPAQLPRLATPSGLAVNLGVLNWDSVISAIGYRVRVLYPNSTIEYSDVIATSFSLIGSMDGLYSLSVMAKANSTLNRDSLYSNLFSYEIKDNVIVANKLRPPLQLSYSNGKLNWTRVSYANGYIININDVDTYTINGGNITSYNISLTEKINHNIKVKTLGDEVNYGSSTYSTPLSFPLKVNSPPNNIVINGASLNWEHTPEAVSYRVSINGVELDDITDTTIPLNFGIDGFHSVKLKSIGDDIYYTSSPYSSEIGYKALNGNPVALPLPAPLNLVVSSNSIMSWDEVLLAESYEVQIVGVNDNWSVSATENSVSIANLQDGVWAISVKAQGDNDSIYTLDSPWSLQKFHIVGDYTGPVILAAPSYVNLYNAQIEWATVHNSIGYEVIINENKIQLGVQTYLSSDYMPNEGVYFVKVRALGNPPNFAHSPFTEEIRIERPTRLPAPNNIFITGNTLNWTRVESTFGYQVEIVGGGETQIINTNDNSYEINIATDGIYIIRVRAKGNDGFYISSLYSQEVIYSKLDGSLGGKENPYLIETIEDLNLIRDNLSSYFRLASDLDLDGFNYEPIGSYSNPFTGYLDGYGHTISNINITGEYSYAGLFEYINGGTIKNLTLDGVTITIDNYIEPPIIDPLSGEPSHLIPKFIYAGGLMAYGRNVTVDECNLNGVVITARSNSVTAGLLGGNITGDITNVATSGSINIDSNGSVYVGGLLGYYNGALDAIAIGTLDNSVTITVTTDDIVYAGGISGKLYGSIISNIDVFVDIDIAQSEIAFVGGGAGTIEVNNIDDINVILSINVLSAIARVGGFNGTGIGNYNNVFTSGLITVVSNTYAYVGGLAGELTDSALTNVISECNIDVTSNNAYVGGLIGKGNVIVDAVEGDNNISIEATGDVYVGGLAGLMIGEIQSSNVVSDITLTGAYNLLYSGGLVGYYNGNITLTNATLSIDSLESLNNIFLGGAVGFYNEGQISNTTIDSIDINIESLNGVIYAGGVVGKHNIGDISGAIVANAIIIVNGSDIVYVGGITAESNVDINNSSVQVLDITASSTNNSIYAGGITGITTDLIYSSDVTGTMNISGAGVFAGGISGIANDLLDVTFTGIINGITVAFISEGGESLPETESIFNIYLGGIVGLSHGDVEEATVNINTLTGQSILGKAYVGGIIGRQEYGNNHSLIVNSDNDRIVTATANDIAYAGGIAGYSAGVFNSLYDGETLLTFAAVIDINVTASAIGKAYAGSFSGQFEGIAEGITAIGNVLAQSSTGNAYAGGVSGLIKSASISKAYISAIVNSTSAIKDAYLGGIVAEMVNGSIVYSTFDGDISANGIDTYIGGIAGYATGNILDSYTKNDYDATVVENMYLGGIVGYLQSGQINRCYSIFNIGFNLKDMQTYIGGIAGYNNTGNIINTYSVTDIDFNNVSSDDYIGGNIGFNYGGALTASYVTGSIKAIVEEGLEMPYVGSLVGANNSTINKCIYDMLMINEFNGVGNGFRLGLREEIMGANCSASGYEGWDGENSWIFSEGYYPRIKGLQGQDIVTSVSVNVTEINLSPNSPSLDLNQILMFDFNEGANFRGAYYTVDNNLSFTVTTDGKIDLYDNTIGQSIQIHFEGVDNILNIIINAQNVTKISGDGTDINPFVIDDATWMRYLSIRPTSFFKLTNNVDLSTVIWEPVGSSSAPFTGGLDGDGYTINGLTNPLVTQYQGLFAYTDGAVIKNLTIEGINVNSESPYGNVYSGSIAAYALNTTIANVTLSGTINTKGLNGNVMVGSVVGYGYNVNMTDIKSTVSIEAQAVSSQCLAGGLAGYLYGSINKSYYKSTINSVIQYGTLYTGGLIGSAYGSTINNSYAVVDIYLNPNDAYVYAGGLVGYISSLFGSANVSSEINDCYASTNIEIFNINLNGYSGGLIGYNQSTVTRSYSSTKLKGHYNGEFIGHNLGTIINCYFYQKDSYNSIGIASGSSSGLIGVSGNFLMSGNELGEWNERWTFTAGYYPRIIGLSGQDEVTSCTIDETIVIDSSDNLINILDYISYTVDGAAIFTGIKLELPENDILIVINGTFVLVMGNGQVVATVYLDGGLSRNITITITNAPTPLFNSGKGTLGSPFIITNIEELNNIKLFKGLHYRLNNDIDLQSINWTSIGTINKPFEGVFDGNGFKLINLTGESLFGYLKNATINNLNIEGAMITVNNPDYAGIIAIKAFNSVIDNCSIDITSNLISNARHYGSMLGLMEQSELLNSSNSMNIAITADTIRYIGGLVGRSDNSNIDNCSVTGSIDVDITSSESYVGGFVGNIYNTEIANSTSNINIIGSNDAGKGYFGGLAGTSNIGNIHNNNLVITIAIEGLNKDGEVYIGGLIANSKDLTVSLMDIDIDIDANNINNIILGGIVSNNINNLNISDIDILADFNISLFNYIKLGGLVGKSISANIQNIIAEINANVLGDEDILIGGLITDSNATINNADVDLEVIAESNNSGIIMGGISGINKGVINDIIIIGNISLKASMADIIVGGIAGSSTNNINSVNVDVNINSDNSNYNIYSGNVVGKGENSTISEIETAGLLLSNTVNGDIYAGSIVGYADSIILANVQALNILEIVTTAGNMYVGGLSGYHLGTIRESYYNGSIDITTDTGTIYAGGIIGAGYGCKISISYSALTIDVFVNESISYIGGIAGHIDESTESTITDCYASSKVNIISTQLEGYTGGLVGYNEALITRCYSYAAYLDGANVGAFIGKNLNYINYSYFYKYDSFNSTGVAEGIFDGLTGVTGEFMTSGVALQGWNEWTFTEDFYPRLTSRSNQNEVVSVTMANTLAIDNPDYFIDLHTLLVYDIDSNAIINCISLSVPDSTVLTIVEGTFAMVVGNGVVILTVIFDGGLTQDVTVTVTNASSPIFNSGAGTKTDPFIITNADQFENIRDYQRFYYKLANDIDLDTINWVSFGTEISPFTGGIDGDEYNLLNLTGESIFGSINGAEIVNLNIVGADITILDENNAGIFAKTSYYSVISNCSIDDTSNLTASSLMYGSFVGSFVDSTLKDCTSNMAINLSTNTIRIIGGLLGYAQNSKMDNCSYDATITVDATDETAYIGGFTGNNLSASIVNSTSTITIIVTYDKATVYVGGLSGYGSGTINYCDITVDITLDGNDFMYAGGLIGASEILYGGAINNTTVTGTLILTTASSFSYEVDGILGANYMEYNYVINDVKITINSGTGTKTDPFIIANEDQFENMRDNQNLYYKLAFDIDLDTINWVSFGTEISPFTGGIDGDGYNLLNLTGESIFGSINGAEIINLNIVGANVTILDVNNAGIFANTAYNSVISNCSIDDTSSLTASSLMYGSFVGSFEDSDLIDCTSNMEISLSTSTIRTIGGLLGYAYSSTLDNCSYDATITIDATDETVYIGGFTGDNENTTIANSTSTIIIIVTYDTATVYVGGLSGSGKGTEISDCDITVDITLDGNDTIYAGGLVGASDILYGGAISNTTVTGTLILTTPSTSNYEVDGIVGINHMEYDNVTSDVVETINLI